MLVVEDGAPAHTAGLSKSARLRLGIHTLTHPPNSPDLNPIEPLWGLLKTRVSAQRKSRESLDALWEVAQSVWAEISEEDLRRVMGSMPARVKAVRKAQGMHSPF
ncbi:hypothetical protein L226DRAFT_470191 [Lentinus tigrinus ALCF2SS1-7]|uniref:uncharacterized protein n=1 Tax=Lentinus tigrinus ALCF2SS1-7 TaxID=1328758 RepID=UPI001165D56F|nr:hypothetical protein L226DRAFT_470191 [Lentinus tigrinus ALCF2SS1-7]